MDTTATAHELAQEGAKKALDHANRELTDWQILALGYTREYARAHSQFTCGELRDYAATLGMPQAPDERAWGALLPIAEKQAIVRRSTYTVPTKRKKSHGRRELVWISLLWVAP